MSNKTLCVSDNLYEYLFNVSVREPDLLRKLRDVTKEDEYANMQISPEQGQFMAMLIKLLDAHKSIEIGAYTGYSALCTAMALPDDGLLVACDINEEWTTVAKNFWEAAGVIHKIDLRLAPAEQTLSDIIKQGQCDTFDFAFIDADKEKYDYYYEVCLKLVRKGGLIAIDNVLWDGAVANEDICDKATESIRDLNKKIYADHRVDISLVPIADGLTLARKR